MPQCSCSTSSTATTAPRRRASAVVAPRAPKAKPRATRAATRRSTIAARPAPGGFVPPSRGERVRAIGSAERLPVLIGPSFRPGVDDDCATPPHVTGELASVALRRPMPAPGADDWLWRRSGAGQDYDKWARSSPNVPTASRRTIYLVPLGVFDPATSPSMPDLRDYASAFFHGLPVRLLPTIDLDGTAGRSIRSRTGCDGQKQLHCDDIFKLLRRQLPRDAYCLAAFTMTDLYPRDDWNFVFGKAMLKARVCCFSFARYDPAFPHLSRTPGVPAASAASPPRRRLLVLRRACKVLSHELTHLVNVKHCVYYHCRMNGSDGIEESDRSPTFLCPVCLAKLQTAVKFDVAERYAALHALLSRWAGDARRCRELAVEAEAKAPETDSGSDEDDEDDEDDESEGSAERLLLRDIKWLAARCAEIKAPLPTTAAAAATRTGKPGTRTRAPVGHAGKTGAARAAVSATAVLPRAAAVAVETVTPLPVAGGAGRGEVLPELTRLSVRAA